jgi:hypothetical protein
MEKFCVRQGPPNPHLAPIYLHMVVNRNIRTESFHDSMLVVCRTYGNIFITETYRNFENQSEDEQSVFVVDHYKKLSLFASGFATNGYHLSFPGSDIVFEIHYRRLVPFFLLRLSGKTQNLIRRLFESICCTVLVSE